MWVRVLHSLPVSLLFLPRSCELRFSSAFLWVQMLLAFLWVKFLLAFIWITQALYEFMSYLAFLLIYFSCLGLVQPSYEFLPIVPVVLSLPMHLSFSRPFMSICVTQFYYPCLGFTQPFYEFRFCLFFIRVHVFSNFLWVYVSLTLCYIAKKVLLYRFFVE